MTEKADAGTPTFCIIQPTQPGSYLGKEIKVLDTKGET